MSTHEIYGKYLGETCDRHNDIVSGFEQDGVIYLVWDLGTAAEYSTSYKKSIIEKNPDEFLWTPYIDFVDII